MFGGRTKFVGVAASALACLLMAAPAEAQFGGILGGAARGAADASTDSSGCPKGKKRSSGSRIAGGILGGIASSAAGRVGGVLNYVPVAAFTDTITASIACKLDPEEQKQAAEATFEATRSAAEGDAPEVGAMAAWTSNTREDVSGTSTVVASNDTDNSGLHCITVADVIIVGGEETRADKRMCRRPPARYVLAA